MILTKLFVVVLFNRSILNSNSLNNLPVVLFSMGKHSMKQAVFSLSNVIHCSLEKLASFIWYFNFWTRTLFSFVVSKIWFIVTIKRMSLILLGNFIRLHLEITYFALFQGSLGTIQFHENNLAILICCKQIKAKFSSLCCLCSSWHVHCCSSGFK